MKQNELKQLKAVTDETRMKVVRALKFGGDTGVSVLQKITRTEPTLLSHHLSVLKDAGIVKSQRFGKRVVYKFAPGVETAEGLNLKKFKLLFK